MDNSLFVQFLTEECDAYVKGVLSAYLQHPEMPLRTFQFNRFEVTVDRVSETVLLQDVLDASSEGKQVLTMSAFLRGIDG